MSRKDLRAYLSLAAILATQTVTSASAETLAIKKISVDASKQLVIEFGGANFPSVPHVLDLPGPNHRVVFDFTDAAVDKSSLPAADELSATVAQTLPLVKSVRYSNLENAPAPTARIVLDVPQDAKVKPRVVKLEQGTITISLTDEPGAPVVGIAPDSASPAETPISNEPAATETPIVAEAPASANPADAPSLKPNLNDDGSEVGTTGTPITSAAAPEVETVSASAAAPAPAPAPAPAEPAVESAPVGLTPDAAPTSAPVAAEPGPEAIGAPVAEAPTPEAAPAPAAAAVESAPASETDKKLGAVKKYNSAVQFHLQGKLTEAIAEYKAALEFNPALAEAHSNLGLIYNQQHNYAQALAEFRKALAINPRDAITYNGIGAALRAEKDLQGAIKNWQTAVTLDAKLATAHYNLGTAYEIQKEYDKAITSYNSAVKNDYRLGEAYYRMGLIMERKRRPDDAATQFQEALKVSGDSEYSEDARQRLAFLTQNKKGKIK
jgi:Flp pilus assembly protein TadD